MGKSEDEQVIIRGNGNVFTDLDLPDPKERLAKACLASRILDVLEARGRDPGQVAEALVFE